MHAASLPLFWTQKSKQVTFKVPKSNALALDTVSHLNFSLHIQPYAQLWQMMKNDP